MISLRLWVAAVVLLAPVADQSGYLTEKGGGVRHVFDQLHEQHHVVVGLVKFIDRRLDHQVM